MARAAKGPSSDDGAALVRAALIQRLGEVHAAGRALDGAGRVAHGAGRLRHMGPVEGVLVRRSVHVPGSDVFRARSTRR